MVERSAPSPGAVTRNRFMLGVLGLGGAIIGITYTGVILRYLYPKGGSDTPPLKVALAATGVTPDGAAEIAFKNGVAGPFYYPTTVDKSVVVGVFVAKKDKNGPLTAANLRVPEQTCTHLGCPVAYNADADQYQCPCHGSIFNRNLSVHNGPAGQPLYEHEFTMDEKTNTLTILKRKA